MAADLRAALRDAHRRDEAACVAALVDEVESLRYDRDAAASLAANLVAATREKRKTGGGDQLLQEYSLSSEEGVALLCLAEALLRIPDAATADRLIRDKIAERNWRGHLGESGSLFVNAATWSLLLTGKIVAPGPGLAENLSALVARSTAPVVRTAIDFSMRLLSKRFVLATTIDGALARASAKEARGYAYSYDMLGEAALTASDAARYALAYEHAIAAIGKASAGRGIKAGPGVSVKLSALHPRYTRSQRGRVVAELLPRLRMLMANARRFDIGFNIDAEECDRLELSLDLFAELARDPALAGWDGMGFVVQAYQKRAPALIDALADLARTSRRRLMVRLVKGAYWDSEIKRAQIDGVADYPVLTRKSHTDLSYLACAGRLLAASDVLYPQFATHNAVTLASVAELARAYGIDDYEFQCLHGMGETLYDNVVGAAGLGTLCRIYAPVGEHKTLLPYLVRRMLENGANSSFVNRLVAKSVAMKTLVEDPLATVRHEGGKPHPAIALPRALYAPQRVNSAGVDLADEDVIGALEQALAEHATKRYEARPLLAESVSVADGSARSRAIENPARRGDVVGEVIDADARDVQAALANAAAYSAHWFATPPEARVAALLRAADLIEASRDELLGLLIREAGKCWHDALAEIREAADYCRYYGAQRLAGSFPVAGAGPGPVVCISPWNFPLAIFVGQLAAALAVGSPVIAKPAKQTPLVAACAVALLHRAGIPRAAMQFLPGRGEIVGAALVADARVTGVVFTGSTEVAREINKAIATRDVRLIAETGGQNAMIVDSSALPEQVVADVLASAFNSAGQRCSALRVLCLQNDIAGRVLAMLKEAIAELAVGDPALLATDVGPVIDFAARNDLLRYLEARRGKGRAVHQRPLPAACENGSFVAPALVEIEAIAELEREVFGPVLHVLRFDESDLPRLIADINATGYGLTMGLHSRIDARRVEVASLARVGNLYVNRNMIGAVVGVQPFGGEGLSGTGPKAGGPLYLHRLAGSAAAPRQLGCAVPRLADAAPLGQLLMWAAASGRRELAAACANDAERSLLAASIRLPGPTGERNTLSFAERGRFLCLALDVDGLLRQFAAVFATGNRAVVVADAVGIEARSLLPERLRGEVERYVDDAALAGVLVENEVQAAHVRERLANGAIVPVIAAKEGAYALERMVVERVVSVNTAAVGGDTALLARVG
jgi:RHH-type proline utilization regulon transcriptional repressor/proline dehydrogenase/delta 1-pyrroline-5-carboxylate dehydrogenase